MGVKIGVSMADEATPTMTPEAARAWLDSPEGQMEQERLAQVLAQLLRAWWLRQQETAQ